MFFGGMRLVFAFNQLKTYGFCYFNSAQVNAMLHAHFYRANL